MCSDPHCGRVCISPVVALLSVFSCLCHLTVNFSEIYFLSFAYFLIDYLLFYYLILRFIYIFLVSVLCQICGLQILSPGLYVLFILTGYFLHPKCLILMRPNLAVFPFLHHAFDVKTKKTLPGSRFQRLSLFFFVLKVLCLY